MRRLLHKTLIATVTLLLGLAQLGHAQTGKTFWFVAPEVTNGHNDDEAVLRITALDEPATVTISLPANPAFTPITLSIPAGQQRKIELAAYLTLIENGTLGNSPQPNVNDWAGWTPGTPFKKGMLIESNANITAYYEIANPFNPDRFTLKGDNALGTEFYIPSQNVYENRSLNPAAREKVDIVATEDNTIIKFTLTEDVEGHAKGIEHTIVLNRGESYSLRRKEGNATRSLGGSHVTSNKPIAITISDDSIKHLNATNYDLVGDQLVPVSVIGREYIVVNTMYGINRNHRSRAQKVFIVATQDNTVVKVNGVALTANGGSLNAGEMTSFDISNKHFDYIESNEDIYVYQFASVDYELGSALVPSISCTGSTSVSISRIYSGMFAVQIMTQKKNIPYFTMQPNLLNLSNGITWNRVEASGSANDGDTWYAAVVDLNASTNTVYNIRNSNGLFHLSVLDANGSSMSYGYFSSFNNLKIDGPTMVCEGTDVILSTKQDDPSSLKWFYDDGNNMPELIASGTNRVEATQEGKYWVEMDFKGCFATDILNVEFNTPKFSIGGDKEVCYNEEDPTITLTAIAEDGAEYDYRWGAPYQNQTTNTLSFIPTPGESYDISLTAITRDDLMCEYTEKVNISVKSIPTVTWNLTEGIEDICEGEIIAIQTDDDNLTFRWLLDGVEIAGESQAYITPTQSGLYEVEITTPENCTIYRNRPIKVNPLPTITIDDVALCPGEPHTYTLSGYDSYKWTNNATGAILGTQASLTLTQPIAELLVTVTNEFGCAASDEAEFKWHNQHVFSFGNDTSLCEGMNLSIEIDPGFINYKWQFNGVDIPALGGNPTANDHILHFTNALPDVAGVYSITAEDNVNGCPVTGQFNLEVLPPVSFSLAYDEKNGKICDGDSIRLVPDKDNGREFTVFQWFRQNTTTLNWDKIPKEDGGEEGYLVVRDEGSYKLEATQDNNCSAESSPLSVQVNESPTFRLEDIEACPGDDLVLKADRFTNTSNTPEGEFDFAVLYNFTNSALNDTIRVIPESFIVEEGNHTVTVYDRLGCFLTLTASAEYKPVPSITIEDASFCDSEGYDLTLSTTDLGIKDYYWSKNGQIVTGTVFEGGEYTLTVVTNSDCDIPVGTITLTALATPTPTALPAQTAICEGQSIGIEANREYRSYQWFLNGVAIADETSATIIPTTNGTYSVEVIAKNGCSATVSTQVTVNEIPTVSINADGTALCPGELATLTITGDYDKIVWSTGEQNVSSILAYHGLHTVRVEKNGCVSSDQITVSLLPTPILNIGDDEIVCPTELPIFIEEPVGFEEYIWHTSAIKVGNMIQANIMDTVNILEVRDSNGCWTKDTRVINLEPEPEYSFGGDFDECETEVELIAGNVFSVETSDGIEETDVISYTWLSNGATTNSILVNQPGEYIVRASDGCWFKTDTFNVRLHTSPVITGLDTMIYARVTVLTDPELGTLPFTYALNEAQPQDSNTFNNVKNGEHTIWVEDSFGCSTFVVFYMDSSYDLEVPNFFTPNGDGINDTWVVKGLDKLPESDIRIYDRHGKLLVRYQASESQWDGTYLNAPVPSDDYWYVIHLKPVDKIIKGNITIKR